MKGRVRFSSTANPVKPDLYRLVLGAGNTLWADYTNLEFGVTADPLMNLGKTITLPGSVASLNVVLRTCASAGAASASAGTSQVHARGKPRDAGSQRRDTEVRRLTAGGSLIRTGGPTLVFLLDQAERPLLCRLRGAQQACPGSNPVTSSEESAANLLLARLRAIRQLLEKFYNRGWVDYILLVLTPHRTASR
jgi:hypothetical protein